MLIDNVQKLVLLDEAAKKGLTRFQLVSIPETFEKIVGDLTKSEYGLPLTRPYTPKVGDNIDVAKIAKYFVNTNRDLAVGIQSAIIVNEKLRYIKNEFWVRSQNLKNKANLLAHTAELEGFKSKSQSVWVFGNSFNDTAMIDMLQTTAWIDSSEGIVFLPTALQTSSITPNNITVESYQWATGSDSLGSKPDMAVDGLESTSWKGLFILGNEFNYGTFKFDKPYNISSLQIDPTGFGMTLTIEVDTGKGFSQVISEIIYKTTTFIIGQEQVRRIRIGYQPATAVLPKSVGIRNMRLYTENTSDVASLYTKAIDVPINYSELLIDFNSQIPTGTKIKSFVSFDVGATWRELTKNTWTPINTNDTTIVKLNKNNMIEDGGYYAVPVDKVPITPTEGIMLIGKNQVEVSAFKKDYVALGEMPHVPQLTDFEQEDIKKFRTWLSVPTSNERTLTNRLYLKPGSSQVTQIIKGRDILPFQYQVENQNFSDLGFILLYGSDVTSICQQNHTYKTSFYVFSEKDYFVDYAKFFFLQGYRSRNFRSFNETNRSYGAFSLFVNGTTVVSASKPFTIYTSQDLNGGYIEGGINGIGENGSSYSYSLKRGWNLVEIMVHTLDPKIYGEDLGSNGYPPFLFLSLYPSFFDPAFQDEAAISKIVASGESKPVSEFELLWNIPQDFNYWAWSSTNTRVFFNTWYTSPIDGYIKGTGPAYEIEYKASPDYNPSISSINLRFDLLKEPTVKTGPILQDYKVSLR